MKTITLTLVLAILIPSIAEASRAVNCSTRKSGSVTITSCSNAYRAGGHSECRSYKSGSVVKTSCR
jgi:hypothetical protein